MKGAVAASIGDKELHLNPLTRRIHVSGDNTEESCDRVASDQPPRFLSDLLLWSQRNRC